MSIKFFQLYFFLLFNITITYGYSKENSIKVQQKLDSIDALFLEYYDTKHLDGCIDVYNEMFKITESANLIEESAATKFWIAYIHYEKRDFEKMETILLETEKYCKNNELPDSIPTFSDINYLRGLYCYDSGDFDVALFFYQTVLQRLKKGLFSFRIDDLYNNIALIFLHNGDYENASKYLQQRLQILKSDDFPLLDIVVCLQNIARNYLLWGKNDLSIATYRKALKIIEDLAPLERNNKIISIVYYNIGEYYAHQEQYDSAHHYLDLSKSLIQTPEDLFNNWQRRALTYIKQEMYDSAQFYLNKALETSISYYGNSKHPEVTEIYQYFGEAFFYQNQYEQALFYYQKGLVSTSQTFQDSTNYSNNPKNFKNIHSKVFFFNVLLKKGTALKNLNRLNDALNTFELAGKLIEEMLVKYVIADDSRYFWLERAKPVYEQIVELALQLNQSEKAWENGQKGKAVLLMQSLKDLTAKHLGGVPDSLLTIERELKTTIASNELKLNNLQESKKREEVSTLLFDQNLKLERLQKYMEENYPRYYEAKYDFKTKTAKELQESLPNWRSAFVEYFMGEETLYIFVVTKRDLQIYTKEIDASFYENIKIFKTKTNEWDGTLASFHSFCQSSYGLYQTLLEQPIKDLPFYINNLIIIPDEEINYISFAALLNQKVATNTEEVNYFNLPYLIKEDYHISYSYSAALLANFQHKKTVALEKTLLGIAPIFSGNPSTLRDLDSLLYNTKEVMMLNSILGGDTLLRENATLQAFREKLQEYRIVHFATHAICNDTLPLSSKIYFSDAAMPIYELFNIEHNLDLAVLSICDAGAGQLKKGEGILSMARAFIQSNCPSIITSLWQVNDKKASNIMESFYENLKSGKSKNVSLANAQRTYLESDIAVRDAHPFYWATFIQVGEISPIFPESFPNSYRLAFILGVIVLLLINLFYQQQNQTTL